jgi:hypothetical protein
MSKKNPAHEPDDLTPEETMAVKNPMVTMPDGTKRVACTECHIRPLTKARMCDICYDTKIKIANWRSKVSILSRNKGKPKFMCPWCGRKGGSSLDSIEICCGNMRVALMEIDRERYQYNKNTMTDDLSDPL